ncbi:MAG: hypothetical protein WBL61_09590 [Bryobacteraceae bacterium]
MPRTVGEQRLDFGSKAPSASTRTAIAQLEAGKGKRFGSVRALMADLNKHGAINGKLRPLAKRALRDHEAGRSTVL